MKKRRGLRTPGSRRNNQNSQQKNAADLLHQLSYEEEQSSNVKGFLSSQIPKSSQQNWQKLATWHDQTLNSPFSTIHRSHQARPRTTSRPNWSNKIPYARCSVNMRNNPNNSEALAMRKNNISVNQVSKEDPKQSRSISRKETITEGKQLAKCAINVIKPQIQTDSSPERHSRSSFQLTAKIGPKRSPDKRDLAIRKIKREILRGHESREDMRRTFTSIHDSSLAKKRKEDEESMTVAEFPLGGLYLKTEPADTIQPDRTEDNRLYVRNPWLGKRLKTRKAARLRGQQLEIKNTLRESSEFKMLQKYLALEKRIDP